MFVCFAVFYWWQKVWREKHIKSIIHFPPYETKYETTRNKSSIRRISLFLPGWKCKRWKYLNFFQILKIVFHSHEDLRWIFRHQPWISKLIQITRLTFFWPKVWFYNRIQKPQVIITMLFHSKNRMISIRANYLLLKQSSLF